MTSDNEIGREGPSGSSRKALAAMWLVATAAIALSLTAGCAGRAPDAAAPVAELESAAARPTAGAWTDDEGPAFADGADPSGARSSPPVPLAPVVESALPPQRHELPRQDLREEWTTAPDGAADEGLYPLADGTFAGVPAVENRDPGISGGDGEEENGDNPAVTAAESGDSAASPPPRAELLPLPNGSSPEAEAAATATENPLPPEPKWNVSYEPRGIVVTIDEGLFATGSASPVPGGARTMDEIATFAAGYPGRLIIVESHTDSSGPAPANMQLSRKRAEVMRAGLIARGFAAQQLEARPYGEAYPAASNASDEGRRRNDRIELVLVPPGQSGEASYRETLEASAGDLIPY